MLLIWNALISGAMDTMPSHPEDLREACNEISAAETSRELQPDRDEGLLVWGSIANSDARSRVTMATMLQEY